MRQNFLTKLFLLCVMMVGSVNNLWAETKPWACDDPTSTLDLQTVTSQNIGSFTDAVSYYLDDEWLVVSGPASRNTTKPTWISQSAAGTSGSTWDASYPFQGSDYYTTKSYATLQSGRAIVYSVTNLKSLKVYGQNNSTSKYLDIFIYTKSGTNYTKVEEIKYTTDKNVHIWENSTTLDPSKTYYIYLTGAGNSNSRVFEVAFERNPGELETPSLSFPETSYDVSLGTSFTTPVLTTNSKGALSYESSNTDVATVGNDGTITLKACGTTVITAKTAASGKYTEGSAQYTLNVNTVAPPAITYDGMEYTTGESATKRAGKILTFTTNAPDAEIWYTTDGSTEPDAITSTGTKYTDAITVNTTTTYKARVYVLDVEANDVQSVVVTFTANVTTDKETPVFSFASTDESVTYGYDFTGPVLTNNSTATPTFESSNPVVAAVDNDGNITVKAVGVTTITATIDATAEYKAAETSYTLTVTENTTAPAIVAETTVFYESFDKCDGTGGNSDGNSGNVATSEITSSISGTTYTDNSGWSTAAKVYKADKCVKVGTSSGTGSITTPALGLDSESTYTLTFKGLQWGSDGSSITVEIEGTGNISKVGSPALGNGSFAECKYTITGANQNTKVKISRNKRFFIDEVKVTKLSTPTVSVNVPSSGWGTYCSPYALDLGNEETTVTAYAVKEYNVDDNSITLVKQTGKVKAKTPLVIQGEAGAQKIVVADAGEEVADNILIGYLSPTYYAGADADVTLMGMSGGDFKKIKEGTIPANRAVLPMETSDFENLKPLNNEGKMTFIIIDNSSENPNPSDGEVTSVNDELRMKNTDPTNAPMYNLAGQRVGRDYKGIVIVNGKKVVR